MRKSKTRSRKCRCGAQCDAHHSRCHKCLIRARWLRRKAWRVNTYKYYPSTPTESTDQP